MPGTGGPIIHLINPFENADGGSEWRTIELYNLLHPHADVRMWSTETPDPRLTKIYPIHPVSEAQGIFPKGGTMVFIGCYKPLGRWVRNATSDRTILVYNTPNPGMLAGYVKTLPALGNKIEMVFPSLAVQYTVGAKGTVQASPIDLTRFTPAVPRNDGGGKFCIGRLSRDDPAKHHDRDLALYKKLAGTGCHIRIMGGMVFEKTLSRIPGIEIMPTCAEVAEDFIRSLDCFYYRTSDTWTEPFGRVIMEAMACGVPAVAHNRGGYTEVIKHGENGFLFETQQEAYDLIMKLQGDTNLRGKIGLAARQKMMTIYSEFEMQKQIDFYVSSYQVQVI